MELHALCYKEPYLAMSAAGVVLYPNIDFLPKVNSRFRVTQLIDVPAMHGEVQLGLHLLCVRRTLKFCLMRTASFRDDDDVQFVPCLW